MASHKVWVAPSPKGVFTLDGGCNTSQQSSPFLSPRNVSTRLISAPPSHDSSFGHLVALHHRHDRQLPGQAVGDVIWSSPRVWAGRAVDVAMAVFVSYGVWRFIDNPEDMSFSSPSTT